MNRKLNIGTVWILLSAVAFSLGGILIKSVPWSAVSINGFRSALSMIVILIYMKVIGHKLVLNKAVIIGAACNFIMALTFVVACKMTSAANAIVLQFTEPIFIIIATCMIWKKIPGRDAIITCIIVFIGILFFFFGDVTTSGTLGNIMAIISGIAYTGVFLIKKMPGNDFESSLIISHIASIIISIPYLAHETQFSNMIWINMIIMGVVQFGISYIMMSKGLDTVSPVTASLTATIEPILNPIIVAVFLGQTIGINGVIGSVLVIGASTIYNYRTSTVNI